MHFTIQYSTALKVSKEQLYMLGQRRNCFRYGVKDEFVDIVKEKLSER